MTPLSRRGFLERTLMIGAGAAAFGAMEPLRRAAEASGAHPDRPDRYYIFCYFSGGWDILLSLDPRDPAVFTAERMAETRIQPAYEQLEGSDGRLVDVSTGARFGPHIGELARHAQRMAVVRGMSMETLSHETGRRRFITAKEPSGNLARGSSAATWLASTLGEEQAIPNLSLRVESYNVDQPVYATGLVVNSVPDLMRTLRPDEPGIDALQAQQLDELLATVAGCEGARQSAFWQQAEASRLRTYDLLQARLDGLFDFLAPTPEMAALRDHYGFVSSGTSALSTPEAHAALAAQAIMGGVSRCVSVEVASGLDTHYGEWASDQGPTQERGFDAVARMIDDLAAHEYGDTGESWLDHTVVVGFSEFSRTPLLNANGGRDHALTNAAFAVGGGVRGGQIIGRSSDTGMAPVPTDLASGAPDPEGGTVVLPEHVVRALFDEVGIDDGGPDLRVPALRALLT